MTSTVDLVCENCKCNFMKTEADYNRRIWKLPDSPFFCSRACNMLYKRAANPEIFARNTSPGPQYKNTFNKKYDVNISWYVKRCSSDGRFRPLSVAEKLSLHDHLKDMWTGNCAFTGLPITRRNATGKVPTENPFIIASVDRIDCNLPYQVGNVQWVSLAINLARNNTDVAEFQQYITETVSLLRSSG
jgi:hypothetical protein